MVGSTVATSLVITSSTVQRFIGASYVSLPSTGSLPSTPSTASPRRAPREIDSARPRWVLRPFHQAAPAHSLRLPGARPRTGCIACCPVAWWWGCDRPPSRPDRAAQRLDLENGHRRRSTAVARDRGPPRRSLAGRQLPVGRADLSDGQPAAPRAAGAHRRQAAPARPLGNDARAEHPLHTSVADHRRPQARDHLRDRPRPWWPRPGGQLLARRHLQRDLSADRPGRDRHGSAVQTVLLPRRHPIARRARNARIDSWGWRTRIFAV